MDSSMDVHTALVGRYSQVLKTTTTTQPPCFLGPTHFGGRPSPAEVTPPPHTHTLHGFEQVTIGLVLLWTVWQAAACVVRYLGRAILSTGRRARKHEHTE